MQKKSLKKEKSTYKVFRKLVKLDEKNTTSTPQKHLQQKKVNTKKSYKNNITHAVKKIYTDVSSRNYLDSYLFSFAAFPNEIGTPPW